MAESQPILAQAAQQEIEYREIPGWPGYRIGSDGTIWSKLLSGGRMRKDWRRCFGAPDKDGYLKFILCRNGFRRYVRIHVVILEVFRGPCPTGHVGAHDNGIKTDNRIDNLFWKTQAENIADKIRHGTAQRGDKASRRKLTEEQVRGIRRRWLASEATQTSMASEYGVTVGAINAAIHGRNWRFIE